MDIGLVYEKLGEINQAIYYYSESAKNANIPSVVKTLRNIGNIYSILIYS